MTDDLDRMLSGGAKGHKFEQVGDSITGLITDITVRQATEFGTGAPQHFDNGDPKEQIVVTLKAERANGQGFLPDDEDDDGHRAVYVKGWGPQRRAFVEAARKSGKPKVGDRFTATFVRTEQSKSGGFPAKIFEYSIQPLEAESVYDQRGPAADTQSEAVAQAQKLLAMGTFTLEQVAAATALPLAQVQEMKAERERYSDDTPF